MVWAQGLWCEQERTPQTRVFERESIGKGMIRRCSLVGGSVPLWEWALRAHPLKLGLV